MEERQNSSGAPAPRWALLTSTSFLVSTPVVVAWLVGDQSSPGFARHELDYAWGPVNIPPVLGLISVVVLAVSGVALGALFWKRSLHRSWLPVVIMLAGAGVVLGYTWRVFTAGVIGANIGAGILMVFGGPLFLVYLLVTLIVGLRARKKSGEA
jgi:hypothetical protein